MLKFQCRPHDEASCVLGSRSNKPEPTHFTASDRETRKKTFFLGIFDFFRIRSCWANGSLFFDCSRGGHGVRWSGMLGRTTVGKAGGDGGPGWADCWRWRSPFPVSSRYFREPRPIRTRSVSTMIFYPTTIGLFDQLAITAIALPSKWDCGFHSSSMSWVQNIKKLINVILFSFILQHLHCQLKKKKLNILRNHFDRQQLLCHFLLQCQFPPPPPALEKQTLKFTRLDKNDSRSVGRKQLLVSYRFNLRT